MEKTTCMHIELNHTIRGSSRSFSCRRRGRTFIHSNPLYGRSIDSEFSKIVICGSCSKRVHYRSFWYNRCEFKGQFDNQTSTTASTETMRWFFFSCSVAVTPPYVILCDVMLIWMLIFLYYYLQTCLWSNKVGSLPHKSRWGIKIQNNYLWVRMYHVYHIASKTDATITDTCDIRDPNSRFAAGHSRGTKSPCCRVRDALSQNKKKPYII